MMDGTTESDFSIERILSPEFGRQPDRNLTALSLESGNFRLPDPVPVLVHVPVPSCLLCKGMDFGDGFCPTGITWFHPNCGLYKCYMQNPADVQPPGTRGVYLQDGGPVQSRHGVRIRTVFTDSQTEQLEALFQLTDYPTARTRSELSRTTGLSEETVRVWFKNRRARRKRLLQTSKVKQSSS